LTLSDTESNDVASGLNIGNYKSCQIWLEGYNSLSTKKAYKLLVQLKLLQGIGNEGNDSARSTSDNRERLGILAKL
jgi:hypothetical protein